MNAALLCLVLAWPEWKPTPPEDDLLSLTRGFPSLAACADCIAAAEERSKVSPNPKERAALLESMEVWRLARNATDPRLTWYDRRAAVLALGNSWLGWERVVRGQFPPPIPFEFIPVGD